MGATAIKGRHRSELAVENLSEKLPGVVEPVGKLAGPATGRRYGIMPPGAAHRRIVSQASP